MRTRLDRVRSRSRRWWGCLIGTLGATAVTVVLALPWVSPRTTLATKAVEALSAETEVLFVGTSHVFAGIRPDQYSRQEMTLTAPVINYALMEEALAKHLPRLTGLRYLVLELDIVPIRYDTLRVYGGRNSPLRDIGLDYVDRPNGPGDWISTVSANTIFRRVYFESHRVTPGAFARGSRVLAGYEESFLTFNQQTGAASARGPCHRYAKCRHLGKPSGVATDRSIRGEL